MRINDGSICEGCRYFEHECHLENGCLEICLKAENEIVEKFVDYDLVVLDCEGYEKR